ncbi:hypothetical protein [Alistipes putredinis]|uniref:hypothetical protein n=1 Tax=Alistipes putredinis TaxID=28117 RepID=UPI00399281F5
MAEDIPATTAARPTRACTASRCATSTPIGAHPSALIGELPRGDAAESGAHITQTAAGLREMPFDLRHDDYGRADGTCLRNDYIDVV